MTIEATVAAGVLAITLQVIALYGAKNLRRTTLMVPCLWVATAASCLLLLAFCQVQFPEGLGLSVMRYAVAASTLCPLIAVLGAKRPQDRGWQWVVAALWLVLVWPAAQTFANPAGPDFEIVLPWKTFIIALIAMGPLNYLPTKHWLAAMFVAGGQVVLFSKYLGNRQPDTWLTAATFCFVVAGFLIIMRHKPQQAAGAVLPAQTMRWLWLRDAYGAFWGLRIMHRVNETAALRNWPVQLTWNGFEYVHGATGLSEPGAPRSETSATPNTEIDQTLDTLLRRFL